MYKETNKIWSFRQTTLANKRIIDQFIYIDLKTLKTFMLGLSKTFIKFAVTIIKIIVILFLLMLLVIEHGINKIRGILHLSYSNIIQSLFKYCENYYFRRAKSNSYDIELPKPHPNRTRTEFELELYFFWFGFELGLSSDF